MSSFKRNIFRNTNKFQRLILFYLTALGLTSLILMVLFLAYLYADIENFLHTFRFFTIKTGILIALPVTAILILITCVYMFYLTNKILGPYTRILSEIDQILASNKRNNLNVREGDEMFEDLIRRINELIGRQP